MIDLIKSFSSLAKGWNGYDAEPPSRRSITIGVALYRAIKIKPFRITPSAVGGIAMKWDNLFVEIYNNGHICLLLGDRFGTRTIMSVKTKRSLATFINLFLFLQGKGVDLCH